MGKTNKVDKDRLWERQTNSIKIGLLPIMYQHGCPYLLVLQLSHHYDIHPDLFKSRLGFGNYFEARQAPFYSMQHTKVEE